MNARPLFFLLAILPGAVLTALACGKDLPPEGETDGGTADGSADVIATDGGATTCSLDKTFGGRISIPIDLPAIERDGGAIDRHPHLTADERTIVFTSQRHGNRGWSLYEANRPDRDARFGSPRLLSEISGADQVIDVDPMLSPDGLTLYFSSTRIGGLVQIFVARRAGRGAPFDTNVSRIPEASSDAAQDFNPFETDAGLWFVSTRFQPDPKRNIYLLPRLGTGFGVPTRIEELRIRDYEENPTPTADGLGIYFSSTDDASVPVQRIWLARRTDPNVPFAPASVVSELDGTGEQVGWLSPDRCRLYYVHGATARDSPGELVYVERAP